ncbi:MAG: hypothetical protein KDB27_00130 [Planctomycetales bacterium]|nr:hypothetical protein [Planctomycetales bacterium]
MPRRPHIISEYRQRRLQTSIVVLLAVTSVIAMLCAMGRFGVMLALHFGATGTSCRLISRTWLGWIAGPIVAFFAGTIAASFHVWLGIPVALIATTLAGRQMGKDRFYRVYPDWRDNSREAN